MDNFSKTNNMKKFLYTTAALLFITATCAFAQENNTQNYIEVSTRVEKQITPDEIYLNVNINEQTNKGKISVEKQEQEMIKTLKSMGIEVEKNLTVKDMDSDLQKFFFKKNAIYNSKAFSLKLSNAKQMAQVFDALNKINISDISLNKTAISPELEKTTKDELLVQAAKKAQENASILATAVGNQAGKIIYIQNYYNFQQPYSGIATKSMKLMSMAENATDTYEDTSLEIAQTVLSVTVLCRFAIK
jgi:uncharacterized protein